MESPTLANGRYRIDRFIGQGGMAGVFLAYDNNLKVERAIKLLHPEFIANVKVRERFINEALAMAQIRHPNVVQIFDQAEDGASLFLVMEYYPLGSLESVLSKRTLTIPEALWVLKEVSSGLAAAHSKGYLHRDIKPENMLLSEKGVHLADFGLVQIPDANQTRTKAVMGTLAYMPPEQRISAKRVVPQSDIYALSASFYCMLTQDLPDELFDDEERIEKTQMLPLDIQKFLSKGRQANIEDRFENVDVFQDAIQQLIIENGGQSIDLSVLSEPSTMDRQRLIRLWSEYTSDSTEREDIHTKETLIWEELSSNPTVVPVEPTQHTSSGSVKNVVSTALTSAEALLAKDPSVGLVDSEQPEHIQSFWRRSVRTINMILLGFMFILMILLGFAVVIQLTADKEDVTGVLGFNDDEVFFGVVVEPEIRNARLEPMSVPKGEVEFFTLAGHIIAVYSQMDDDRVTHKLFWGPNFSQSSVAEWGNKSFDLEGVSVDWTQGKHMFEISMVGFSRGGEKIEFTLWDPRYTRGTQKNLSRDSAGQWTLQCEDEVYALKSIDSPSDVNWYHPSMDRRVTVIAKDLHFNYFYMDQSKNNNQNLEYRFFMGKKGEIREFDIIDSSKEHEQLHVLTTEGAFKMKGDEVSWTRNPIETSPSGQLQNMNVFQNSRFIYTELGVYPTKLLGTPCDIQWMNLK